MKIEWLQKLGVEVWQLRTITIHAPEAHEPPKSADLEKGSDTTVSSLPPRPQTSRIGTSPSSSKTAPVVVVQTTSASNNRTNLPQSDKEYVVNLLSTNYAHVVFDHEFNLPYHTFLDIFAVLGLINEWQHPTNSPDKQNLNLHWVRTGLQQFAFARTFKQEQQLEELNAAQRALAARLSAHEDRPMYCVALGPTANNLLGELIEQRMTIFRVSKRASGSSWQHHLWHQMTAHLSQQKDSRIGSL